MMIRPPDAKKLPGKTLNKRHLGVSPGRLPGQWKLFVTVPVLVHNKLIKKSKYIGTYLNPEHAARIFDQVSFHVLGKR